MPVGSYFAMEDTCLRGGAHGAFRLFTQRDAGHGDAEYFGNAWKTARIAPTKRLSCSNPPANPSPMSPRSRRSLCLLRTMPGKPNRIPWDRCFRVFTNSRVENASRPNPRRKRHPKLSTQQSITEQKRLFLLPASPHHLGRHFTGTVANQAGGIAGNPWSLSPCRRRA